MIIAFDAKRAFHNQTGLGNYSRDVIRLFSNLAPRHQYLLCDSNGQRIDFDYNKTNSTILEPSDSNIITRKVWRQTGVAWALKQHKAQVYHGLSNEIPYTAKKPWQTIVTIHDLIFERHPEWFNFFDREIYRHKFKYAAGHADLVVAVSQQTKDDLIELFQVPEEKIEVVYQGCSPGFKEPVDTKKSVELLERLHLPEKFLLYVGTIEERKNLHTLVHALKGTSIHLVIVGRKTSYFHKVAKAMKDTDMAHMCHFPERLSTSELACLYQQARIFVYPSLYEGFGIPVIESLNCGTPVITGKGSMQEAAGKGGIAVNTSSVAEIRDAILKLWENDELLASMAAEGKNHVARFDDNVLLQRWAEVYQKRLSLDLFT